MIEEGHWDEQMGECQGVTRPGKCTVHDTISVQLQGVQKATKHYKIILPLDLNC